MLSLIIGILCGAFLSLVTALFVPDPVFDNALFEISKMRQNTKG